MSVEISDLVTRRNGNCNSSNATIYIAPHYIIIVNSSTSIFLPSTTVEWSCSLALSASELLANVTKPNPWNKNEGRVNGRHLWNWIRSNLKLSLPWIPAHWRWSQHQGWFQISRNEREELLNRLIRLLTLGWNKHGNNGSLV